MHLVVASTNGRLGLPDDGEEANAHKEKDCEVSAVPLPAEGVHEPASRNRAIIHCRGLLDGGHSSSPQDPDVATRQDELRARPLAKDGP